MCMDGRVTAERQAMFLNKEPARTMKAVEGGSLNRLQYLSGETDDVKNVPRLLNGSRGGVRLRRFRQSSSCPQVSSTIFSGFAEADKTVGKMLFHQDGLLG